MQRKTKDELSPETADLRRQIAELKVQLATLMSPNHKRAKPVKAKSICKNTLQSTSSEPVITSRQGSDLTHKSKPRPWYCFQSGEDGHIATSCSNAPNPPWWKAKEKS